MPSCPRRCVQPTRPAIMPAWHVDDVDKLQRNGQETVYVIEVEHARQEFDLYYSEDGVLLREAADTDGNGDHGDMLPQELPKAVSDFIARKYPGARIIDAEREKGNTEVDIIFAGKAFEVCFGTGDAPGCGRRPSCVFRRFRMW